MRTTLLSLMVLALLLPSLTMAKTFGAGVSLSEETPLSAIIDNPDNYVGKAVKVTGLVVDVCSRRGCWIFLAGDRDFEKIRVKVTDGEIVFPMDARGKIATVQGVVEKLELSRDQVIAQRRHHAEESGDTFDPASVTGGETILRLRGLGAEIPSL